MLDFVEANFKHELGEEFYSEFEELIESAQGVGSARLPDPASPASAPAAGTN
jgi:predicted  nucleic acid-binding Zn-ribbon protein